MGLQGYDINLAVCKKWIAYEIFADLRGDQLFFQAACSFLCPVKVQEQSLPLNIKIRGNLWDNTPIKSIIGVNQPDIDIISIL